MDNVIVDRKVLVDTLNYLSEKPYNEVHVLINKIVMQINKPADKSPEKLQVVEAEKDIIEN